MAKKMSYGEQQGKCAQCGGPFIKKGKGTLCIECKEKRRIAQHKTALKKQNEKAKAKKAEKE